MEGAPTEDRPLGWAERLVVVVACAGAAGVALLVLGFVIEWEGALVDALLDRGAPEWVVSLAAGAEALAPIVVLVAGVASTGRVGIAVADLLGGGRATSEAARADATPPRVAVGDGEVDRRPWPLRAASTVGTLLLLWGGLGLLALPWDVADHSRAQLLISHGTRVEATTVRVEVGAPWYVDPLWAEPEVRHVEVRIDGVAGGDWVNLTGIISPEVPDTVATGWQPGSEELWYSPPLPLYYLVEDEEVAAMAVDDILVRLDSGVTVEPVLPAVGLLLVLGGRAPDLLARWTARRAAPRGGRHRAPSAGGSRRPPA